MDTLNINYDDFNTNLCDGLQSILASSEMSDVTLAVEGKHFKAHQVILSMFSTYFRECFQVTPSRNTIFFMKNVKHRIMHNLLLFMYEGKVQIPTEDFQMFVDTANELKIKGLMNDMDAAEISRGQVNNADNIEHVIDSTPSLKRAFEPMKEKAKKHKPSHNALNQSTSEAIAFLLDTNKHIREADDFNKYGIQVKEEDADTVDVEPPEIYDLDDDTNELDGAEDNTIISKESDLPLASQIDYSVIGEMEEYNIDEIQPNVEDTKEKMDHVDVGPIQIQDNNTMSMRNDLLLALNHDYLPPPPPAEGISVTVSLYVSQTTKKVKGVIWDDFRYYYHYECKLYGRWRCTGYDTHKCKAKLFWAVKRGLITLSQSHNHEIRGSIFNQRAINLEPHTLYAVSNEYFRQHVMSRGKGLYYRMTLSAENTA